MSSAPEDISPEILLKAYCSGLFPMADGKDGEIHWYSPDARAIVPLESVTIHRSLRRTIRKRIYEITINADFDSVIHACADREESWISESIIRSYSLLHDLGFAHSIEAWKDGIITGGLYGVSIGGAFFGESMFSRATDASKVAFVAMTQRLKERRFMLLDAQFMNPHLKSLGAIEIPRNEYLNRLQLALEVDTTFI